jgi:hypothetical protein
MTGVDGVHTVPMIDVSKSTKKVTSVKLPSKVNNLKPVRYCFSAATSIIEVVMSISSKVSSDICEIGLSGGDGTVVLERQYDELKSDSTWYK